MPVSPCTRVIVLGIAVAVSIAGGLLLPAAGQQAAAKLPALDGVFDKTTANDWAVVQGDYVVSPNKPLGKPVLTTGKNALALQSKTAASGPREIRVLVRLGAEAPGASAD